MLNEEKEEELVFEFYSSTKKNCTKMHPIRTLTSAGHRKFCPDCSRHFEKLKKKLIGLSLSENPEMDYNLNNLFLLVES